MGTTASLVRALGQRHTYNLRRNPLLLIGMVLGCSAGLLSIGLAIATFRVGGGRDSSSIPYALVIPLLLAHPVLFGILWGALGAVRSARAPELPNSALSAPSPGFTEAATGLYSPEYMIDHLRRAVARVARTRETVTILILETVESRDESALRSLADSVQSLVREGDTLGRIGPRRLLLIVHGELPCALCLIERMADAVYHRCHLTLRAGVARWPEDGQGPAALLEAADLPLKASWHAYHSGHCPEKECEISAVPSTHP